MMNWTGIWIPLITPMRDGAPDLAALDGLVRDLAAHGVAGFVACGSTGEAAMLDAAEQQAVLAATLQAAGTLPVLMGLSGIRPVVVAARARQLAEQHPGVAGWLLPAPAYVRPTQAGIADFFECVASATDKPLVAYDIPARTGVRIEPKTLLALADHPRIVAVKDCSGDRAAAQALLADGRLALLAGNDDELFDQLARGAAGGITASAQAAPAAFVELQRLLAGQRLHEARALWQRLAPLVGALFVEPNPAPLKGLLARQGRIDGELRPPLRQAAPATVDAALSCLSRR